MLPSKGYFKALTCPFFENGLCGRPHCHYRHSRKEKYDPQDASSIQAEEAQAGKENYVEGYTDDAVETFLYEDLLSKSEGETLNESISDRESILEQVYNGLISSSPSAGHKSTPPEVPCYKPTPISELKKRHIPVAFDPNIVKYAVPKSRSVRKPKPEYVPRGENGKEVIPPASYSPTPSQLIKRDSSHEYLPVGSSWNHTYTPSKITSLNSSNGNDNANQLSDSIGSPLYSVGFSTGLSASNDYDEDDDGDFDLDEIAPELDMIGQLVDDEMQESDENTINNESDTQENSLDSLSLNISSTCNTSDIDKVNKGIPTDTLEKCDISEDDLLKVLGGEKEEEVKNNKDNSKTEKHSNLKPGRTKDEKSRHKSSSSSSKHSSSNKHSSSSSSRSHSKSSSSKSSHSKSKHHSSSSSSSKEKSSHSSSSSKKKTDHHSDKNKNKDSQEQKHSNSSKSHSSDKYKSSHRSHKNGDNTNSSSGSKSHKNDEKDSRKRKHSESHSRDSKHSKKEKHSSKSDSKKKSSLSDSKHKSKDQKSKDSSGKVKKNEDEEYKSSSSDVEEVPLHSPVDAIVITDSDDSDVDNNSDLLMSDNLHEEHPIDTHFSSSDNENIEPQLPIGNHDVPLPQIKQKKRISHLNAEEKQTFNRHIPTINKNVVANPSQTLIERWHKKRFAESDSSAVPLSSSSEDLPGPPTKVRIAHVPNVSSLLNAKKNILTGSSALLNRFKNMSNNLSSSSAGGGPSSGPRAGPSAAIAGPSGAVAGPSRAVAGPSGAEGNPPPLILPDPSSKINVVQRQLHLDRLFGLCLQVYSVEVAKRKAAQLELECCQASKSMMTYKNKISQAYLKLKKELSVLTGEEMPEPEKPTGEITEEEVYELMQKYLVPKKDLIEFSIPIRIKGKSECCGYIDPRTLPDRRPKNMPPAPLPEEGKFECLLCFSTFTVDENGFSIEGGCQYHLARPSFVGKGADRTIKYDCCGGGKGCVIKDCHVRDTIDVTCMPGFVETLPAPPHIKKEECGVYALDCEMCFTTVGLELVRCTVVNYKGETIFDELAIPPNPIIDYNTRFSGIEERHLVGVTNSLNDIREKLMEFIHAETILIGHGLGNDLKALKMIHSMIVDTTYVFPHKLGAPRKRRLAELSKEYLCREIQNNGAAGHDSSEDATACMDLMLKKIRHDKKSNRPRKIIGFSPPPRKSAPPMSKLPKKH